MVNDIKTVLVTGGAGYVGSSLVPKLLEKGYAVRVLDLFIYGSKALEAVDDNPRLTKIRADIRDIDAVRDAVEGSDAVIHLACISNDPSYDLNPNLGKSINFDAFEPLVISAKNAGVQRFIYASSSSVYGVKAEAEVHEDLLLEPLTDYSKFKAMCETVLEKHREAGFTTCTVRPSTVCGYAPRLRLDLVVNILATHALETGKIRVFGGSQKRPNIHIDDMTDLYLVLLEKEDAVIEGKIFNAGYENYEVMELANIVKTVIGEELQIDVESTDDLRSYHVSSAKLEREVGFKATRTIEDAVRDLAKAMKSGEIKDPMNNPIYYNIKQMQRIEME